MTVRGGRPTSACDITLRLRMAKLKGGYFSPRAVCCVPLQVPSAVFIQPPLGTVGLTEEQAREKIAGDIDVYVSKFKPMKNTITGREEKTLIKILVEAATDKVPASLKHRSCNIEGPSSSTSQHSKRMEHTSLRRGVVLPTLDL